MDILEHIKDEHDRFKNLIKKIETSDASTKKNLFHELYAKIYGHHEAEEHILFPLVKEEVDGEDKEVVLEMIEEHSLGSYQFSVLEKTSVDNETWDAKFSVLKEVLEHHMDEEEAEFMPIAREVLSEQQRAEIYEEFETVHEENTEKQAKKLKQ
ncbi:MAG: hypothetical protein GX777_06150 [Fastidiosipila sp.]|nr:hypothetical protein [Fastidiosipila sp.]